MSIIRVLHITNNYPTNQHPIFGIFIKEQINSLTALGVDSEVFFMNSREDGKKAYLKALVSLRHQIHNGDYEIIHCHHSYSAVISLLSGGLYRRKCVLSYQSDPGNESGILVFKILSKYFDRIILKNKAPEIKFPQTVYLPNGVDTDIFVPRDKVTCKRQLGLQLDKRYILFMDSYNRRPFKRIDRFYEIMEILKGKYGHSNLEPLILTNTDRSLVPFYICAVDLHLLTSDFEGSPNSVKECIACNTPVVSTPVGNVKELLAGLEGCYVAPSFNPPELAELVNESLNKSSYLFRESIFEKELDIHSVARKLYKVYENLICGS